MISPDGMDSENWQKSCGSFDIRIDRDGTWFHEGAPIRRLSLVKLFASVLRRDDDGAYWLVTPAESGRIDVEDVPFTAVELLVSGSGRQQVVSMRTNLDHIVTVNETHPIRVVEDDETGAPTPYVLVRDRLEARILRPVFYELVELGQVSPPGFSKPGTYGVWSCGEFFSLGEIEVEA